jgi:hypothetical protein
MAQKDKLIPGTIAFSHAHPELAAALKVSRESVRPQDLPGLRALVKAQFPKLTGHQQAKIVENASGHLGSLFTGGVSGQLFDKLGFYGPYPAKARNMQEYSEAINRLSQAQHTKDYLEYFKGLTFQKSEPEGQIGFSGIQEVQVTGKQTLSSHFVQPGTDALDTTIPKKVESEVQADFFNYLAANPEHGIYNAMYLQDMQYQKEVRYAGDLALPRSGNDQLYLRSFELAPQNDNQQPVQMELMDKFETDLYSVYASKDPNWDPLHDKRLGHDPIMDRTYVSHFVCANSLMADGVWPYPDPDKTHSSAFVNTVGFKPLNDAWLQPSLASKWLPTVTQLSASEQLKEYEESGFASFQRPVSYNSFPGVDPFTQPAFARLKQQ